MWSLQTPRAACRHLSAATSPAAKTSRRTGAVDPARYPGSPSLVGHRGDQRTDFTTYGSWSTRPRFPPDDPGRGECFGHPHRRARRLLPPSTRPDSAPVGCRVRFHGRFRPTGLYEALTERHDQLPRGHPPLPNEPRARHQRLGASRLPVVHRVGLRRRRRGDERALPGARR